MSRQNNESAILEKINELAQKLAKSKSSFTRADLAYELKSYGIVGDSAEINRLVWAAWVKYNNSPEIRKAFTNNAGNQYLADQYKITAAIMDGNTSNALSIVHKELRETDTALNVLSDALEAIATGVAVATSSKAMSVISGTSGIENIQKEASAAFASYSELVNCYEAARCNVQETVSAFVELRSDIISLFKKYVLVLTDIFGDSIKVIEPQLFDFNKIEWIDVQGMLKQIELQYTTISSRCSTVMGEITDNFRVAIESSVGSYKVMNSKEAGLIMAGLGMLGHYLDANTKTNQMKTEFLLLKDNMRRDATGIKADMLRLAKIFAILNNNCIPQAELFYAFAPKVLDKEVQSLIDACYTSSESKKLVRERETLLSQIRELEHMMNDESANINYFKDNIEECNTLLDSLQPKYNEAMANKPSSPNFLVNILTLGSAKKKYNRNIYEWNGTSGQLIQQYESLKVDVGLNIEDQKTLENLLESHSKEYGNLSHRLSAINKKMLYEVQADDATKAKLLESLKDIIKLLHLAKGISETKLNEKDIKTVSIKDFDSIELGETVNRNIEMFTNTVSSLAGNTLNNYNQSLSDNRDAIEQIVQKKSEKQDGLLNALSADGQKQGNMSKLDDISVLQSGIDCAHDEAKLIQDKMAIVEAIPTQQAVMALQSWLKYNVTLAKDKQSKKHYADQLEKFKAEFQESMSKINDRAAFIRAVASQVSSAHSNDVIKQGLMALSDFNDDELSDQDWNDFLSGNKTIKI